MRRHAPECVRTARGRDGCVKIANEFVPAHGVASPFNRKPKPRVADSGQTQGDRDDGARWRRSSAGRPLEHTPKCSYIIRRVGALRSRIIRAGAAFGTLAV